ncbi:MAG TPA: anti-sigma factor [Candidatus Limnocylindrales bacterium]|nr:anti-sigma factor [Candidatus Limnocylindrales bacterium]
MDHDEVLEQIELAAVEPGGLERLMAGDTPAAGAVVAHLAGCERCADELRRMTRAAPLLRDLVRTTPPADLRERTLAYVREHGRPRGETAASAAEPATATSDGPRRRSRIPAWAGAAAAAIVLVVGSIGFIAGRAEVDRYGNAVTALEAVNKATLDISADPGSRRVRLASTDGESTSGTLLFSPDTSKLVVVASDLEEPPSGKEYRCWVMVDGQRRNVGKMFFADELAYWVGDTPEVKAIPDGTTFGVSLTDVGRTSLDADPVIVGQL